MDCCEETLSALVLWAQPIMPKPRANNVMCAFFIYDDCLSMARFGMSAFPAVGLLPFFAVGDWRETGAVAADSAGAVLALSGCMGVGMSVYLGCGDDFC